MQNPKDFTRKAAETAQFRFAIIAPVIQGLFPDASQIAYFKRVTEHPLVLPDGSSVKYSYKTPEKWTSMYKKGGLEALMPTERSDKGTTRVLPDEAIDEIYRIKQELPRINAPLVGMVDAVISYRSNEQLKFFMVADRFMKNAGEFDDYDEFYEEMDASLAKALVEVEKSADAFGREFAQKHCNDRLHYFVGAGNQYGATYSYAMCYWEEQHWIRTRSIHSAEFFHGMLEVIEKDTPVTVFIGEDSQRKLSERVAAFLPKVCANYTIIDTKDYALEGISEKYRGNISHLVMHAVTQRIDAHMEQINCHPMVIRRYYRQFDY